MNKTFATVASALVLTMAVAATAEARDGFYIAVRGGYTDYNMNSDKDNAATTAKFDFNGVWNISGALGYKYKYFRVEGEYVYRDDDDDEYTGLVGGHKTSIETDSFMANAYLDIMPNYWISPYFMGGLGVTRVELSNQDIPTVIGTKETFDKDNFTWQIGAGLSLRLNRCLNFDMGYRYVDMGTIEKADVNAHEYYGGFRYTF